MPFGQNDNVPSCGAYCRTTGEPCKNIPVVGQKRCRMHGGINPTTGAKRAEVIAERQVAAIIGRLDIEPVEDPLTALKMLAGEALAWKDVLATVVSDLTVIRYRTDNAEQIRGEVAIFERAMDRCASILGMIAKLKIDERLATISEQQAALLTQALFASYEAAGLPITDVAARKAVAREFGRHLQAVS
jgi:hypothetical protein